MAGIDTAGTADPAVDGVAVIDGFADHLLEGRIGGDHDGGGERPAERALRLGRLLRSSTSRVKRSSNCVVEASSSTVKRAATLASNGNWCSRRVQKAWMV